jgi:predicted negative regulator of RcsB-dependent stress response
MKKNIILLIICICTCATYAQNYKEDFSEVKRLFHERASSTQKQLEEYLEQYPYTPYADEIGLMQGVLAVEKDKFKQAYKILNAVNPKNLSRTSENTFNFYMGYTLLSLDDYDKALAV